MYKQSALRKKWNYSTCVQILYSYFRCTVRLFLGCVLFVARRNVIRALWKIMKTEKISYRKNYIEEFVWGTSPLFRLPALLSMLFVLFFVDSLSLIKWHTCRLGSIKIHNIPVGRILCDDIMIKGSKVWKSLTI